MADLTFEGTKYPLISTRKNGDRLIGYANTESAEYLCAAGTPPVHGLAKGHSDRVGDVRIGQRLNVERRGNQWFVSDAQGTLGALRWSHTDVGRPHAVTGNPIHFPDAATLAVMRLVISRGGRVVNFAGMVTSV